MTGIAEVIETRFSIRVISMIGAVSVYHQPRLVEECGREHYRGEPDRNAPDAGRLSPAPATSDDDTEARNRNILHGVRGRSPDDASIKSV